MLAHLSRRHTYFFEKSHCFRLAFFLLGSNSLNWPHEQLSTLKFTGTSKKFSVRHFCCSEHWGMDCHVENGGLILDGWITSLCQMCCSFMLHVEKMSAASKVN